MYTYLGRRSKTRMPSSSVLEKSHTLLARCSGAQLMDEARGPEQREKPASERLDGHQFKPLRD